MRQTLGKKYILKVIAAFAFCLVSAHSAFAEPYNYVYSGHGDSIINGVASRGPYQIDDDPAIRFFAGLRAFPFDVGGDWGNPSLFAEYKFTTANPDPDVDQGVGGISADTHHYIF